jgi:hypothetical protein
MDLKRLLELSGVQPIDEVINVPDLTSSGIDQSVLKDGKPVFSVEGHDVILYNVAHQDAYIAYDGDGGVVASVVFDRENHNGTEYYTLKRAFTEQKYRGSGIAVKITIEAKKLTGYSILSDEELTSDGHKMWVNLAKVVHNVCVYSYVTGDVKPLAGNEKLLKDNDARYVFLWERTYMSKNLNCNSIYKCNEFLLTESNDVLKNI